MHNEGFWVEELIIPSLTDIRHETEEVEGIDGSIPIETTLAERVINAVLQFEITDGTPMAIYKRRLASVFNPFNEYYLVADEDPSIRYNVRLNSGFSVEEITWEDGKFEVEFIMFNPIRESANINKKVFTTNEFTYLNEGNYPINLRKQSETEITFKGISTNLTITNNATGDVWKYNGSTTKLDIVKLKGVQAFKGPLSIFGQTNKKLLSFAVGNNEFMVSGASGSFELTISTRFYFL